MDISNTCTINLQNEKRTTEGILKIARFKKLKRKRYSNGLSSPLDLPVGD